MSSEKKDKRFDSNTLDFGLSLEVKKTRKAKDDILRSSEQPDRLQTVENKEDVVQRLIRFLHTD
jgi:hypothetical protein